MRADLFGVSRGISVLPDRPLFPYFELSLVATQERIRAPTSLMPGGTIRTILGIRAGSLPGPAALSGPV